MHERDNYNYAERQAWIDRGFIGGILFGAWWGGLTVYLVMKLTS